MKFGQNCNNKKKNWRPFEETHIYCVFLSLVLKDDSFKDALIAHK